MDVYKHRKKEEGNLENQDKIKKAGWLPEYLGQRLVGPGEDRILEETFRHSPAFGEVYHIAAIRSERAWTV